MYIGVTLRRYRAVKDIGRIKMSVGIIAYYRLMQICQVYSHHHHHHSLQTCCASLQFIDCSLVFKVKGSYFFLALLGAYLKFWYQSCVGMRLLVNDMTVLLEFGLF